MTVNTVSPGYIDADMVKAIRQDVLDKIVGTIPVKRLGEPSEIASIIAWIASEESGHSTRADFSVNGGCTWVEGVGAPTTDPAAAGFVFLPGRLPIS